MGFAFLDPGPLRDGELEVVLVQRHEADPVTGWVAWYEFELRVEGECAGELSFRAEPSEHLNRFGGQFGYEVEERFRGRHFAERAVRLVLPLARRHGFTEVWITCNPDNLASRRTCERLGAVLVEIAALPSDNDMYRAGDRQKCRYRLPLA